MALSDEMLVLLAPLFRNTGKDAKERAFSRRL